MKNVECKYEHIECHTKDCKYRPKCNKLVITWFLEQYGANKVSRVRKSQIILAKIKDLYGKGSENFSKNGIVPPPTF